MANKPHLSSELFAFLEDRKAHNDRDWFQANQARYERELRDPMLAFIEAIAAPLKKISPELQADPRPVGGSFFRIYRDTRFSKDRSPYKTHAAAQFRHRAGKGVHAPGFYLHLEPGAVFVGAGLWGAPGARTLAFHSGGHRKDPGAWKRVVNTKAFKTSCVLEGESAKRPPRGFEPDHELIDDIRRKDFIAVTRFSEKDVLQPGFLDRFIAACRAGAPLNAFICQALGHAW